MASGEKLNIREMWKNRTTPWLDVPCGTCGKNIRLRAYSSEGGKPRNAGTPDETWYCAVCRHLLPPEESPAEPPKKVTRETCLHCEAPIDNNRSAFGAKFCSYVCEEDMERLTKRDLVAKLNIVLNAFTVCEAVAGDTPPLFANTQEQADWHRAREAQKLTVLLAQAMLILLEERLP